MLYKPCVMQGFEALAHVAEGSPPCILHSINPMCQATLLRHPFGVPLARDELRLLIEQMVGETADKILTRRQRDVEDNTVRAPKH